MNQPRFVGDDDGCDDAELRMIARKRTEPMK